MSKEFAGSGYTLGQSNAIIKLLKKQAGEDGPERFLRGEIIVSEPIRSWIEKDGIIYFSVTSRCMTGPEWISHLMRRGGFVSVQAQQLLCSRDFVSTNGVTYQIAIIKGNTLSDTDRTIGQVRVEADQFKLIIPNTEIACLIRDKFTDTEIEDMGLIGIVTMHKPINNLLGHASLLSADRYGFGQCLSTCSGDTRSQLVCSMGCAFVVAQV